MKSNIENEYTKLKNEVNELTTKINQTYSIHEKQVLQTKRGNLTPKINALEAKLDAERDANAWNGLTALLKERRPYIVVEVNRAQIEIPEDLIVEISYNGCKHKQKMHLADLLRHKRAISGNLQLFNEWHSLLTETGEISGRWWCDECRKEKDSIRNKFFTYNDKEAGQAQWSIKHYNLKVK